MSAYNRDLVQLLYFNGDTLMQTHVDRTARVAVFPWINLYNNSKRIGDIVEYSKDLLYCDSNGQVWKSSISFDFNSWVSTTRDSIKNEHCVEVKVSDKWKLFNQLPVYSKSIILNSREELNDILRQHHPYTADWMDEGYLREPMTILCCPQLEQLYKAGYAFAERIIDHQYVGFRFIREVGGSYGDETIERVKCFNQICKPGTKPKDIFKVDRPVYSLLKDEPDLLKWNRFRLIYKQGNVSPDTLATIYHSGFDEKQLKMMSSIINMKYDNKPIFTWNSLIAYLRRLDMYEAIETEEALPLIKDVIQMSQQLNIQPNVTGDSIKREHDVLARNIRQKHDEIMELKMDESCKKLARYDYSGDKYFIRGIRSYADLIDEAKQQHNCVASYASSIVNGRSMIYVMRDAKQPDKSLVTVELSPESKEIRQRYRAYNHVITSDEQIQFLDDWVKKVKRCDREKAESISAMLESKSIEPEDEIKHDKRYIYFSTIPVRVNSYATLDNLPLSIESYDQCITSDSGNTYYGYLEFDEPLSAVDMLSHHLVEDKKENLHVRHNYIHF